MSKKPYKIKRYKKSFGDENAVLKFFIKIIVGIIVAGVILGLGWILAEPILDTGTSMWYSMRNGGESMPTLDEEDTSGDIEPALEPSEEVEPQEEKITFKSTGKWQVVDINEVSTIEKAQSVATRLKSQEVTHILINLKDENGNIKYDSNLDSANLNEVDNPVDIAPIVNVFLNNSIVPSAEIYAFKDRTAPVTDRTMAVLYQNQEGMLWLNTSPELGGFSWLNPANDKTQKYIKDIALEISTLGFQELVVCGVQYPTGTGLELAGYGANETRTQPQVLKEFISELDSEFESLSTRLIFSYPDTAISGDNLIGYTENPVDFGMKNLMILPSYNGDGTAHSDNTSLIMYYNEAKNKNIENVFVKVLTKDMAGALSEVPHVVLP